MKQPIRIQRKRTKGWRMPPNTVYVGRPTKWGNPFKTVKQYKETLVYTGGFISEIKKKLKGKNLACWCPLDQPCHADVLLRIANNREGCWGCKICDISGCKPGICGCHLLD